MPLLQEIIKARKWNVFILENNQTTRVIKRHFYYKERQIMKKKIWQGKVGYVTYGKESRFRQNREFARFFNDVVIKVYFTKWERFMFWIRRVKI